MSDGPATARRRVRLWGALGSLVVVGAIVGLAVSAASRPAYTATATSFVSVKTVTAAPDLSTGRDLVQQVEQSYADVATTPLVLDAVISTLGLGTTASRLAEQMTVETPADTTLLRISVTDASAERASVIANEVQSELGRKVGALTPTAESGQVELSSIARASAPAHPSSPDVLRNLLLGALGGAAIWLVALAVRAARSSRPRGPGGTAAPSML
jgi:capsular polysaccharide biosynthesis protein